MIKSNNEYSTLRSIIIGTATNAHFPVNDKLFTLSMSQAGWLETPPPSGPVIQRIIDETNEDLQKLADTLAVLGVDVHRPDDIDYASIDGQYGYCPRDSLLVVDDLVIETPMSTLSRSNEANAFSTIKRKVIAASGKWISAPRPRLHYNENVLDGIFNLTNNEPIFDAANVCRFGNDLLYLISDSGNEAGAKWLQTVLGDKYTVHTTDCYASSHIDSTIVPISKDTVVLNASRVNDDNLPDFLKSWNKIYITDDMIIPQDFHEYPYASKWIAINMLAIGNNIVICDKNQPAIIHELKIHGFTVIPLELRHSRTLGGGFHCVTLDLVRE